MRVLNSLNFRGVELADSPHRAQLDEVRDTFAALSNDALLYPFRIRRDFPAPGTPLRGWYGEGLFNNLGQFFTLYARIYAATGDERFATKARELLDGWAETIDENGYFFNATWAGAKEYSYDKLVCGLLDLHEYVGHGDALPILRRISEWMWRYGDRSRRYAWNGMGPLEWYTLPEYLLRAYTVTGDPLYRELADVYFYDEFYDALLDADNLMSRADQVHRFYQAHSHLNTLNSAAARYEVTGERKFLDVVVAGYDFVRGTQTYATGMFGPLESFVKPGQLAEVVHSECGHAEVSCPSWAMMRLVRHLIELTGEARYGDWMELNIYNGIGAAPPTRADGRANQYFADYGLDGARKTWGLEWSCCSATNPINMAEYVNQIYYTSPDGLYVCLYLPSRVTCRMGDAELRLTQRTAFPAGENVEFDVALDKPAGGALAFRIPGWLAGPAVLTVNGNPVQPLFRDGWAVLDRVWHDGDLVMLTLPMCLDVLPVEPDYDAGPVALRYGPVVLVEPRPGDSPRLGLGDVAAVASSLSRTTGLSFTGTTADGRAVGLVPYFAVEPDVPYAMHFDDERGRVPYQDLEYDGPWEQVDAQVFTLTRRRTYAASEAPGAYFRAEFEGTGVLWAGYRSPIAGFADVFIDGSFVERVTQLAGSELPAFLWRANGLPPGRHELKVVVAGEAPDTSRGVQVNVKHIRGVS
ncbi:hypothetical protein GCM10022224_078460 [Nonomuraea antimicrobica]|uniref:DUF1680 family protein n=1 Tax=Nonomuraea antimicrobica TaxID=561173 RepID=A0ABP7D805_9ACTN